MSQAGGDRREMSLRAKHVSEIVCKIVLLAVETRFSCVFHMEATISYNSRVTFLLHFYPCLRGEKDYFNRGRINNIILLLEIEERNFEN